MSRTASCSRRTLMLGLASLVGLGLASRATANVGHVQDPTSASPRAAAGPPVWVIDSVTVVDVEGGKLRPLQRVVIAGNHIQAVGDVGAVALPPGALGMKARGKYLIPGLWDMHVHPSTGRGESSSKTRTRLFYPLFIAHGVTGIRDAASAIPLDTLVQWRREILAGTRVGPPRQLLSGRSIDLRGGGYCGERHHICVSDTASARHVVDSFKAAGADMIKTYGLSKEMYFVIAAEARRLQIPFGGHIQGSAGDTILPPATAAAVSDSGARIIDHMSWGSAGEVDTLCGGKSASVARCQPLVERFRRNGTWIVPTLVNYMPTPHLADRLGKVVATFWAGCLPRGKWLSQGPARSGYLDVARRVGLPMLAGSDANEDQRSTMSPGFWLHGELAVLVAQGLSPLEALRAATLNPARAFHLTDSLGTVAPGKLADLVLLDADPLADITNTTAISAVIANGRFFDRQALDNLLIEALAASRGIP